jgi:hypothetical protein
MSDQQAAYVAPLDPQPEFATIEILEVPGEPDSAVIPNELRINGVPLYTSADEPITISPIEIGGRGSESVLVTVTFIAKRVVVGSAKEAAK